MRHRRGLVPACAGLGALLLAPLAFAQSSGYTFTRTPGHGPRGTVVSVAGTGCAYEGKPYERAEVTLYFRGDPEFSRPRVDETYAVAADGSFGGDLRIPSDAPYGAYRMLARCYASDMAFPVGETTFTVDAPKPPPTRSPSPSPTRTTASPTPARTTTATATPRTTTPPPVTPRPTATAARTPSATASPAVPSPASSPASPAGPAALPLAPGSSGRAPAVALAAVLLAANIAAVTSLRRS